MRGEGRALASFNGKARSNRAAALLAFGAGIGAAAITARSPFATITAATAPMATAAAMAFATAAVLATAFAAGAFTFGARGVTTRAIATLEATATAATVAATSALIAVATTFAAFAVTFTGLSWGGGGGFEAEETFQPRDEAARAFGLRRRVAVALLRAGVTAGFARFKALTFTTGLAAGIATGLGIHRVEFLGGFFRTTGLAGARLDAKRRAIFAARARVA